MMMCVINNSGGELELNEKELSILILLSSMLTSLPQLTIDIWKSWKANFDPLKKKAVR